jgi:hypothetical protein
MRTLPIDAASATETTPWIFYLPFLQLKSSPQLVGPGQKFTLPVSSGPLSVVGNLAWTYGAPILASCSILIFSLIFKRIFIPLIQTFGTCRLAVSH